MLAARSGLARQKVNYHLRELERHGLVELVEERRKGNVTERVMRATAASFVISPAALAAVRARSRPLPRQALRPLAARPGRTPCPRCRRTDHQGRQGSQAAGNLRHRWRGPIRLRRRPRRLRRRTGRRGHRAGGKYHDESAPGGRAHRVIVAVHPRSSTATSTTTAANTTPPSATRPAPEGTP